MAKICLKCGYERQENETVSDLECPQCRAIYAKVEVALIKAARERTSNLKLENIEQALEIEIDNNEPKTKKYDYSGYSFVSWIFGTLFFLVGSVTIWHSFLAGVSYFVASALVLPFTRELTYKITNIKLTDNIRIMGVLVFTVISAVFQVPNSNYSNTPSQPIVQQAVSVKAKQEEIKRDHVAEQIHQRAKRAQLEVELAKLKTPEQIRKEKIKSQFSAWDGSHKKVESFVKNNMKNPDSYQHIETRYTDKGDYLLVGTKYRGTNSFNAIVPETKLFKVDIETGVVLGEMQ